MGSLRISKRGAYWLALLGASTTGAALAEQPPACKPQVWQSAIAAFQKKDAEQAAPPGGVVFVGSSSIRLWDLPRSFPDLPAINRGFGGSQICDATHYLDQLVVKHRPRTIVLYSGDNDVAAGKSAEQVHRDFRSFVAEVRKALPETSIVVISIKPSIARWKLAETMQTANRLIAADCKEEKHLHFIDVWPVMIGDDGKPRKRFLREDNLHLSEAGYAEWTKLVRPYLEEGD